MGLQPGQLVQGKYRIVRLIGEGGMGAVYEGENTAIGRRVAIKVLRAAMATSPDAVQRFEQEARAAGRIGNDHILEVLDLGTLDDGDRFMVLEYLDGETLHQRLKTVGRFEPKDIAGILRQILEGLGAAHAAGIVHRDLKPENIFILRKKAGRADFVKIIDFGISKFNSLSGDGMRMTATGAVMGTPYYMSPEQARGAVQVDHRSDLYAVGVILYEAVTGRVPYEGVTFNDLLFKIVLAAFTPARDVVPDLDPAFDTIVTKAMAKDPNERFQSAEDFDKALERWETTGRHVTLPPETGETRPTVKEGSAPAADAAPLHDSRPAPLRGTSESWAQSHAAAPPQPSKTLVLAAIGIVALLLATGITLFLKSSASSTATAASAPVHDRPPAAVSAPATPAAVSTEPAAAVSAPPEVTPAGTPAEPAAEAPSAQPPPVAAAPRATPVRPRPAAAKPAAAQPAAAAPQPASKPKRDFGY